MKTVSITGNTYPVKDQLKDLGAKWSKAQGVWVIGEDKADEARAIVAGAGAKVPRRAVRRDPIALRAPGSAETKAGEVRIRKLTDTAMIEAFFGAAARSYDYTVTRDDFDEYDMEGSGEYFGVNVPAELGTKWDAGLAACKAKGMETRSRDGLAVRLEIMHGSAEIPAALEKSLAEKEKVAAVKAAAEQAEKDRAAAYAAHTVGYECVDADAYSGEYWTLDKRATLELIAEYAPTEQPKYGRRYCTLHRLPNGDLMEIIDGERWVRWTKLPEVIAEGCAGRSCRR